MTTRKRNDTWPPLTFTPTGADAATLIGELSGASTAAVIMRGTTKTLSASVLSAGFVPYDEVAGTLDPAAKVNVAGALDDATGAVEWDIQAAEVDSEGYWLVEIEYDLDGDGVRIVTAPTGGYFPLRLIEDLGDAP